MWRDASWISLIVGTRTPRNLLFRGHITGMKKSPRVAFQPKRITETDWQIEASIPGSEIRIISGLVSKADVDDWMAGNRKIAWLKSQGYAK
jgi:hypothetical protein